MFQRTVGAVWVTGRAVVLQLIWYHTVVVRLFLGRGVMDDLICYSIINHVRGTLIDLVGKSKLILWRPIEAEDRERLETERGWRQNEAGDRERLETE